VSLALEMCDVLSALHGLTPPLVHRDFTPDNLIVKDDGTLVLIDFAVAVGADSDTGDAAGKAAYMAPEQFKGKPTIPSDIYALGCTLYFILPGQHPEPLTESHPMFADTNIGQQLNDVVAGCTKLNSGDRFADAQAVRKALEAIKWPQPVGQA